MNPIEVSHLTKHFSSIVTKRGRTPEFVLDDVSFTVERGYVTGFIGANGSGKTTAIKAVLGMIHPDSGTAATVPHERIGVVFDAPPYNGMWRVRDVGRGLSRFFPTWSDEAFDRQIAGADLDPAKRVKDLSRGMGMRLQMAAALAHAPELLILDEPTGGLDRPRSPRRSPRHPRPRTRRRRRHHRRAHLLHAHRARRTRNPYRRCGGAGLRPAAHIRWLGGHARHRAR